MGTVGLPAAVRGESAYFYLERTNVSNEEMMPSVPPAGQALINTRDDEPQSYESHYENKTPHLKFFVENGQKILRQAWLIRREVCTVEWRAIPLENTD